MLRIVITLTVLTGGVWAQTANFDGSKFWFTSSLPLKGTDQPVQGKVFLWEQGRPIRLFYEKPASFGGDERSLYEAPYHVSVTSVARDESVIAITGSGSCFGGSVCVNSYEHNAGEIWDQSGKLRYSGGGGACLSPSGTYGLLRPTELDALRLKDTAKRTLIDLRSGAITRNREFERLGNCLGDNGAIALSAPLSSDIAAALRRPDGSVLQFDPKMVGHTISADGSRLLASNWKGAIFLIDVRSGATQQLTAGGTQEASIFRPFSTSADLSVVAYVNGSAVFLTRVSDRSTRKVFEDTNDPWLGISLSGDGKVLFVSLRDGRIRRLVIETAEWTEIVPPVNSRWLESFPPKVVTYAAGSSYRYDFGQQSVTGIQEMRIGRRKMIMLSTDEHGVTFQVPWDAEQLLGEMAFILAGKESDVFESIAAGPHVQIQSRNPKTIAILHTDFGSAVTKENPARPGEILHVYGTGYGPVLPAIDAGQPGPTSPLAMLAEPLQCSGADVLFGGLAPGLVGTYQVDLRVSPDAEPGPAGVFCGLVSLRIPVVR